MSFGHGGNEGCPSCGSFGSMIGEIKQEASEYDTEESEPDDDPDDSYYPSYHDDSPTSYTGSSSVSAKKESESGGFLTGAPLIIKLFFFAAIIFIDYNIFFKDITRFEAKNNEPKVSQLLPIQEDKSTPAQPPSRETHQTTENSRPSTPEPSYDSISLKNECSESIFVAVYYSDPEDGWISEGWWEVPARKTIETGLQSNSSQVFFYAKNSTGTWNGNNEEGAPLLNISDDKFSNKDGEYPEGENLKEVPFFSVDAGTSYGEVRPVFSCK